MRAKGLVLELAIEILSALYEKDEQSNLFAVSTVPSRHS